MTKNNCSVEIFPDRVVKTFKFNAKQRFLNELKFYEYYSQSYHFVPNLLDYDHLKREIVLENVGQSLTTKHYRKNKNIYKNYTTEINLMVNTLKKNKIYHNDIRYKNVCINDNQELYLIDFEVWSHKYQDKNDDKILPDDYKIFVICAYPERINKYLVDKRYEIFKATWWEEVSDEMINERHFRYNCGEELKRKITACSDSHLRCLQKIKDEKINNAIIIEDDAIINFERLSELDGINDPCYIGGIFFPPVLKDTKTFIKPIVEYGINTIEPDKFVINNAHGYYMPNYLDADLFLEKHYEKRRAIDVEFKRQQIKKKLKYFVFPAISTLDLKDAQNGFTWGSSNYNLKDDLSYY